MKNNENETQPNNEIDEILFEEQTKSYSILTLSIIIVASIGLIVGAWYIYKSYQNKNYDEVVVISADQDEIKTLPLDPGGMVVNNMDKDVYNTIDKNYKNNEKVEVLLPAAEEPINKKELLLAEMSPPVKQIDATSPAPVVPAAPAAPAAPDNKPEVVESPVTIEPKQKIAEPAIKSKPVIEQPQAPAKKKLEAKEAPTAIAQNSKSEEDSEEYIKPVTAVESKNKAKFASKPENFFKVQIASFKSVSDAEKEWKILTRKHPKILSSYQRYIVSKEIEGKGLFQRLQVGPFESESAAKKACSQFKEVGINCFIIKP